MRFILGLTGGIGSGKSAASQWFEQHNISVIDADIVAREIIEPNQPALKKIQQSFGNWVIDDNGRLDRRALREHIFQDTEARKTLEAITHPAIREAIIVQLQQAKSPYVILVSPLLFETNQHLLTQHTLLIDASEEVQIDRASQRDTQSIDQIKSIIKAQMPRAQKQKLANDIVLNDGDLNHLYQQLEKLHQHYLERAAAI